MGLIRYWQPPTENEQKTNSISLLAGLAVVFYFFALSFKSFFWWFLWIFSLVMIVFYIMNIFKSNFSMKNSKIGIDLGITTIIFLLISIILHLFLTYLYFH